MALWKYSEIEKSYCQLPFVIFGAILSIEQFANGIMEGACNVQF